MTGSNLPKSAAEERDKQPRIGLFFTPWVNEKFVVLERSVAFEDVATEGGFKTLHDGHVDVWADIVQDHPSLRQYPYEYFPRGRVNWREEDDIFIFLADAIIFEEAVYVTICQSWNLSGAKVEFLRDPHYRAVEFERLWRRHRR